MYWTDKGALEDSACQLGCAHYGTKLHMVAQDRANGLPKAEYIGLTGAAEHDLTALRQVLPVLRDGHLYGDKIYADQPLKDTLSKQQNLIFETPGEAKEGTRKPDRGRKRHFLGRFRACDSL